MRIAAYLFLTAFVLFAQIAMRGADVPKSACDALRADGYFFDRFDSGRGDVFDAQGNRIALNLRDETILRACYRIDASPLRAPRQIICTGCAPQTQQTPQVKYASD